MALKDAEIRAFQPVDTPYRKADSGGLYLEIFPNGSKLWRWKFRAGGKEKRLALGAYPQVTLKDARLKRDAASPPDVTRVCSQRTDDRRSAA